MAVALDPTARQSPVTPGIVVARPLVEEIIRRDAGSPAPTGQWPQAEHPLALDGAPASPHGVRVVSRRRFARGDAIWPVSGSSTAPSERTIQIGPSTHVEDVARLAFLNHSCDPNTVVDTSAVPMLFALRDIAPGEELAFFYPSTEWDMVCPFVCWCGAPRCLGRVAGARYLSVDTLARYFVNAHIRQLLSAALGRHWSHRPACHRSE
jgi:hypothetical protein